MSFFNRFLRREIRQSRCLVKPLHSFLVLRGLKCDILDLDVSSLDCVFWTAACNVPSSLSGSKRGYSRPHSKREKKKAKIC